MTDFVMAGADQTVLLHHMAFYGLADILHSTGTTDVTMRWDGGLPVLGGAGLDADAVESAVRTHIEGRRTWTSRVTPGDGRGAMSPRLTVLKSDTAWQQHQALRETILDELTDHQAWADLRYLAALGEPSYWSFSPRNEPRQDHGASRWEMQPRNHGSEFVGNRLRPLSDKLLARQPGTIAAGLSGATVVDELGGKPDSVSATGLTTPGPVDNALVWCALWGIGNMPLALRRQGTATSSGHLRHGRDEWFYVPVWASTWRPARLRSILASQQLHDAATNPDTPTATTRSAAAWPQTHGVRGLLRFPIHPYGSGNAPERRAHRGEPIRLRNDDETPTGRFFIQAGRP